MNKVEGIKSDLKKLADLKKGEFFKRFFKTGEGQYGYGDVFIGITVPKQRGLAKKYFNLGLKEIEDLLKSKIHEERLVALLILVDQFKKSNELKKEKIYKFYLENVKFVNNWDLVDSSADKIVGGYLLLNSHSGEQLASRILLKLANSENIWERRIAIIATYQFMKDQNDPKWTFKIAEILLEDSHDLIQKAVGWMLREAGKRSGEDKLKSFLDKHYKVMPRTMLRYSIERLSPAVRQKYLSK